jgi:hypothetical protein
VNVRLEPPKHIGHVLQYIRTGASVLQVLVGVAVLLRVYGLA